MPPAVNRSTIRIAFSAKPFDIAFIYLCAKKESFVQPKHSKDLPTPFGLWWLDIAFFFSFDLWKK